MCFWVGYQCVFVPVSCPYVVPVSVCIDLNLNAGDRFGDVLIY